MKRLSKRNDESGQAVVEYILMLVIGVAGIIAMSNGLRSTVFSVWQTLSCDIAAPCPECIAPPGIRNRIAQTCRN